MGFAVIQGYGLTETAPIVTLNHPFKTSKGSVGTPIAGVELRIADDGEILVRGENVTSGYYGGAEGALAADGWLHTGDIGERDEQGRVFIKGRKKEMIVTPEGLNVFPEDVERVLDAQPGVRESAVVGVTDGAQERVHAVLVLEADARRRRRDPRRQRRAAGSSAHPHCVASGRPAACRARKAHASCKRAAIREWVVSGARPVAAAAGHSVEALLERFTRGRQVAEGTTLEELGLSSLERVELMVALEDTFQVRFDEIAVRAGRQRRRSSRRWWRATRRATRVERARGLSVVEPAAPRVAAAPACRRPCGSCRWRASSRTRASKGCEHLTGICAGRWSSRRITRVTSTCR